MSTHTHRSAFRFLWRVEIFLLFYRLAWYALLPVVGLYFWRKGRREPLYRQHWAERCGRIKPRLRHPVWMHSASLGELRGAAPLVTALLAEGHQILITTLTPAGRSAAEQLFATALHGGQLQVAFAPLEVAGFVRAFISRAKPRCAIMTEIDTWPVLLHTLRRCQIPLAITNAQYSRRSFERDRTWFGLRTNLFTAYELVLCKSVLHAQRFREAGCKNVVVAGETRFDLPIAPHLLGAAQARAIEWHIDRGQRAVICIASATIGEDEQFLQAFLQIKTAFAKSGRPSPLLVYVPRSPQRFDSVDALLRGGGLSVCRRSAALDHALQPRAAAAMQEADVFLGDSLGEMYFYLALSQVVVVGSSFVPLGSHNIIEPLALKKPVIVGHSIWGIEYPVVEAMAAGVAVQVQNADALASTLIHLLTHPADYATMQRGVASFYADHAGAADKHMRILKPWLGSLS